MPTQITSKTGRTREGLQTVRDNIEALLAGGPTVASLSVIPAAPATADDNLDGLASKLKARTSSSLHELARFRVDDYVETEFTREDVATAKGRDLA